MDSEKYHEIQEYIKTGRPPGDDGPFYHHAFWESYKGSIKGKFGGLAIGGIVGAIVGTVAMPLLVGAGVTAGALNIIGGLAAAGMYFGYKEFSEVGRITGAVAAASRDEEHRMQQFEQSRFDELQKDINQIKAAVGIKPTDTTAQTASSSTSSSETGECAKIDEKLLNYRTTHLDPTIPKPDGNGLMFWKIALVGAAVGAGVGLLLTSVPIIAGATTALTSFLPEILQPLIATPAAAAITCGMIGASFGINRDAFRKVFDKTDMLFKGMFRLKRSKQPEVQQEQATALSASAERPPVSTIVYPDTGVDYPTSDTFHRDQLTAARARQVLSSIDHSAMSKH